MGGLNRLCGARVAVLVGISSEHGIRVGCNVFVRINRDDRGGAEASVNHVVEESFPETGDEHVFGHILELAQVVDSLEFAHLVSSLLVEDVEERQEVRMCRGGDTHGESRPYFSESGCKKERRLLKG